MKKTEILGSLLVGMLVGLALVLLFGCSGGGSDGSALADGGADGAPVRSGRLVRPGVELLDSGTDGSELQPDAGELLDSGSSLPVCLEALEQPCDTAPTVEQLEVPSVWHFTHEVRRCAGCPYECAALILPQAPGWEWWAWAQGHDGCRTRAALLGPGTHLTTLVPRSGTAVASDRYHWIVEARPVACLPEGAAAPRFEVRGPYSLPSTGAPAC